jgi:DNA-binding response OmpR family regulator
MLLGYCIGDDVYVDIRGKRMFNIAMKNNYKTVECIAMRETMLRLMLYMLKNANGTMTPTEKILSAVWDANGLRPSRPRLRYVMQQLKIKLNMIGIPDDFIMKVERKGYYVKASLIRKLYVIN